jgi:general secretion pathway protein F
MAEFLAQVLDPAGGTRRVRVSADSVNSVAAALGVAPVALLNVEAMGSDRPGARRRRGRIDLRLFSQELALLLHSGIPLLEALRTLQEKDAARPGHAALDTVLEALRQGLPVSQALARAPADFDELFLAIVSASERSGQLVRSLQDHAAYLAWSQALRGKLVAACIYPLLLLGVGGAVVMFLLLYVLPRFATVFENLGDSVPDASRWLIDFGVWTAAHPLQAVAAALALPAAAVLALRQPAARDALLRLAWQAPGLGARWRLVVLARLYRGLSVLLAAGVPVPAALRLITPVLAPPLRPALVAATMSVESGQRLSVALRDQGLATPVALRMLRVGEGGGELPVMLERAAAFHDEEIARLTELVARAVNPLLMLVMGVVIGGIVVLMYLPIFSLMEQVK